MFGLSEKRLVYVRSIRATVQGARERMLRSGRSRATPLSTVVLAHLVLVCGLEGQGINLDTLSLFELPGVMVVIEGGEDAEQDGLFVDSLRRDVEVALSDAGIPVFSEDEWQVTIGNPLLLISLDLVHPSDFFYLFNIETELQQLVVLARDSTIPAYSATWSAVDVTGSVGSERLPTLRQHVLRQVDQFISALAVSNSRYRGRWFVRRERSGNGEGNAVESSSNNVKGSTDTDP